MFKHAVLLVLLCQLALVASAFAAERHRQAVVEDPFLELRTGPGRGYPVTYVAERGEQISVLRRRTAWYQIRLPRGQEGWVHESQLAETLDLQGRPLEVSRYTLEDHRGRRWELGALYGDFGGANVVSAYGGFSFTENLSGELWISEALGRFSNSTLLHLNVVHLLFPQWRASPYFTLGGGKIHTEPKATLVATIDRTDSVAHAGIGVRTYLSRRFVFRAEYKSYVVFTSRDDNEEIREWKAGFSFFF